MLEELVTFKKYGTLAATAEHLLVTQPTVTRGMQKIEDEFGVKIFDRQPNKITLTKTGELAAAEAEKIINQNNQMVKTVQKFDFNQQNISVASVAPGPVILLRAIMDKLSDDKIKIAENFVEPDDVANLLANHDYNLILSNQEIINDTIEARYLGTEKLSVNLNKFTYQANQGSVSFKDLAGMSFIVLSDIGIWKKRAESYIPDAKFLYQDQVEAFTEITKYSDFPYFSTNISHIDPKYKRDDNDQIEVPISDEDSKIDFYGVYLKAEQKQILPLVKTIQTEWQKRIR